MLLEIFDSIIIRNEISIYDFPPVLQLSLNTNGDTTINEKLKHMKMNLITAAFKERRGVIDLFGIPNKEEENISSPFEWSINESYKKRPSQSDESFVE